MNIAIITGASSGLGEEFTKQITNHCLGLEEIWVIARRKERLEALAQNTSVPIRAIPLDLSDASSLTKIEEQLRQENPTVSVLINCAGYGKFGNYFDVSLDDTLGMIDLNCRALVGVTTKVLPYMTPGSHILQMCSISAFLPLPLLNVYASTKAFVFHYSKALSAELKDRNISVTALCPGWVNTDFIKTASKTENPNAVSKFSFITTPEHVVEKGLSYMKKGKMIGIVGFPQKLIYILSKITPSKLAMKFWLKSCNSQKP